MISNLVGRLSNFCKNLQICVTVSSPTVGSRPPERGQPPEPAAAPAPSPAVVIPLPVEERPPRVNPWPTDTRSTWSVNSGVNPISSCSTYNHMLSNAHSDIYRRSSRFQFRNFTHVLGIRARYFFFFLLDHATTMYSSALQ